MRASAVSVVDVLGVAECLVRLGGPGLGVFLAADGACCVDDVLGEWAKACAVVAVGAGDAGDELVGGEVPARELLTPAERQSG